FFNDEKNWANWADKNIQIPYLADQFKILIDIYHFWHQFKSFASAFSDQGMSFDIIFQIAHDLYHLSCPSIPNTQFSNNLLLKFFNQKPCFFHEKNTLYQAAKGNDVETINCQFKKTDFFLSENNWTNWSK